MGVTMDLVTFVNELRSAYVQEFVATFQQETGKEGELFSELTILSSGGSYRQLYVVDFMRRFEGKNIIVEIGLTPSAIKGPANFEFKGKQVTFDAVSWDAIEISGQPPIEWSPDFEIWFARWLDPNRVPDDGEVVTGIIHSVGFIEGGIQIDFGTAPSKAAIELIELLQDNGIEAIRLANARE